MNNPVKLNDPDGQAPDCPDCPNSFFIIDVGPFIYTRGTDGIMRVRRRTAEEMKFLEVGYIVLREVGDQLAPGSGSVMDAIKDGSAEPVAGEIMDRIMEEQIRDYDRHLADDFGRAGDAMGLIEIPFEIGEVVGRPEKEAEFLSRLTFDVMNKWMDTHGYNSREVLTGRFQISKFDGFTAGQVMNMFNSTYQVLHQLSTGFDLGSYEGQSLFIDLYLDGSAEGQIGRAINHKMQSNFDENELYDKL
ncbi:MAG: hypothetical protein MRY83_17295, partial [Flavobacteriales bacterium]|nr:hypothetical protein [Flavobacteriales bacterium]